MTKVAAATKKKAKKVESLVSCMRYQARALGFQRPSPSAHSTHAFDATRSFAARGVIISSPNLSSLPSMFFIHRRKRCTFSRRRTRQCHASVPNTRYLRPMRRRRRLRWRSQPVHAFRKQDLPFNFLPFQKDWTARRRHVWLDFMLRDSLWQSCPA